MHRENSYLYKNEISVGSKIFIDNRYGAARLERATWQYTCIFHTNIKMSVNV